MIIDELLLQFEKDFFKYKFCHDKESLNSRIHDDFIEYGMSGLIYKKTDAILSLNSLREDRHIEISNFQCESLCSDVMVIHYLSVNNDNNVKSLRTSIWKKDGADWKLYFHQGTLKNLNNEALNSD